MFASVLTDRKHTRLLAIALFAMVAGCAVQGHDAGPASAHVLDFIPTSHEQLAHIRELDHDNTGLTGTYESVRGDFLALGRGNALRTNFYVREEAPFYHCSRSVGPGNCTDLPNDSIENNSTEWPVGLPRLCIALSGGGIRSAAFSLGVLQGLNDAKILQDVDVISAVSGGAYALSWLMLNKINAEAISGQPTGLEIVLDDLGHYQKEFAGNSRFIPKEYGLFTAASAPLVGAREAYWAALYATFQTGACKLCAVDGELNISDLPLHLLRHGLPYPVIGVNARAESEGACQTPGVPISKHLSDRFFEIAPLRQGFAGTYTDSGLAMTITDAVSLSGAAISKPDAWYCPLAQGARVSLGEWWQGSYTRSLPTDFDDATSRVQLESKVKRFFLSDGGFADNLAVFPLTQRMCKTTVVVDAEHDPLLELEGYTNLTTSLRQEEHIGWTSALTNHWATLESLKKRLSTPDTVVDSIFHGSLGPIPFFHRSMNANGFSLSNLELDVYYVKLGFDSSRLFCESDPLHKPHEALYCREKREAAAQNRRWSYSKGSAQFPQYPTTNQDYSDEQFEGLRSLGRQLGKQLAEELVRR